MSKGIVTEYNDYCVFCGKPTEAQHHLIWGKGNRDKAENDGIKIPCCNKCHNMGDVLERIHENPMAEKLSKIAGQLAREKHEVACGLTEEMARSEFRLRFGESYL